MRVILLVLGCMWTRMRSHMCRAREAPDRRRSGCVEAGVLPTIPRIAQETYRDGNVQPRRVHERIEMPPTRAHGVSDCVNVDIRRRGSKSYHRCRGCSQYVKLWNLRANGALDALSCTHDALAGCEIAAEENVSCQQDDPRERPTLHPCSASPPMFLRSKLPG